MIRKVECHYNIDNSENTQSPKPSILLYLRLGGKIKHSKHQKTNKIFLTEYIIKPETPKLVFQNILIQKIKKIDRG